MKPSTARHRADTTARPLIAYARSLGVGVVELGGTIDAAFYLGRVVRLVDFKSRGGTLEPSQAKLVAAGVPIAFVLEAVQVEALVAEMRREVSR